jgi:hypothetical protein
VGGGQHRGFQKSGKERACAWEVVGLHWVGARQLWGCGSMPFWGTTAELSHAMPAQTPGPLTHQAHTRCAQALNLHIPQEVDHHRASHQVGCGVAQHGAAPVGVAVEPRGLRLATNGGGVEQYLGAGTGQPGGS